MSTTIAPQSDPPPRRMSARVRIIIAAIVVLFAALHAQGMALMMSASAASPADMATLLRGD
jgi:hypothetical protein